MPVPSFRNSRSHVRRRRSQHALKPVAVVIDKKTGEPRLPHHFPEVVAKSKDLEKTIDKATAKAAGSTEIKPKAAKKVAATASAEKAVKKAAPRKAGRKK